MKVNYILTRILKMYSTNFLIQKPLNFKTNYCYTYWIFEYLLFEHAMDCISALTASTYFIISDALYLVAWAWYNLNWSPLLAISHVDVWINKDSKYADQVQIGMYLLNLHSLTLGTIMRIIFWIKRRSQGGPWAYLAELEAYSSPQHSTNYLVF